jgi:hypothetical protein
MLLKLFGYCKFMRAVQIACRACSRSRLAQIFGSRSRCWSASIFYSHISFSTFALLTSMPFALWLGLFCSLLVCLSTAQDTTGKLEVSAHFHLNDSLCHSFQAYCVFVIWSHCLFKQRNNFSSFAAKVVFEHRFINICRYFRLSHCVSKYHNNYMCCTH